LGWPVVDLASNAALANLAALKVKREAATGFPRACLRAPISCERGYPRSSESGFLLNGWYFVRVAVRATIWELDSPRLGEIFSSRCSWDYEPEETERNLSRRPVGRGFFSLVFIAKGRPAKSRPRRMQRTPLCKPSDQQVEPLEKSCKWDTLLWWRHLVATTAASGAVVRAGRENGSVTLYDRRPSLRCLEKPSQLR